MDLPRSGFVQRSIGSRRHLQVRTHGMDPKSTPASADRRHSDRVVSPPQVASAQWLRGSSWRSPRDRPPAGYPPQWRRWADGGKCRPWCIRQLPSVNFGLRKPGRLRSQRAGRAPKSATCPSTTRLAQGLLLHRAEATDARTRSLTAAVRGIRAEGPVSPAQRGAVLRALGAPLPPAPGIRRTSGGSGLPILRGARARRRGRGLAGSAGRTSPASLLRELPRAYRLASASRQRRRGRTRRNKPPGGAGATATARADETLFVSNGMHIRRLGAAVSPVPLGTTGRPASASRLGVDTQLPHPPRGTTGGLVEHAEPGVQRHPLPVSRGAGRQHRGCGARRPGEAR